LHLGGLALRDRLLGGLDVGRREWRHQRVRHLADREPPIGDGAVRIVLDDRLERLDGLRVVEIVQQRHGALELALRRAARGCEMHGPEAIAGGLVSAGRRSGEECGRAGEDG
jgi:hypothetical protein